jgi:putative copper resistance protein D
MGTLRRERSLSPLRLRSVVQPVFDLFGIFSVLLRAATLVCQSLLIGGVVFYLWIARSNVTQLLRAVAGLVALVLISSVALNSFVLHATVGEGFSEIVGANFFVAGVVGSVSAALLAGLVTSAKAKAKRWIIPTMLVLVGCSVMTDHAASRMADRTVLMAFTGLHQVAVGTWIGGLPYLWVALRRVESHESQTLTAQRFSNLAVASVAVMLISGAGMSVPYVGSLRALYGTSYGVMILMKLALFGMLLCIGALNRKNVSQFHTEAARYKLRYLLEAEIGIGLTAILAAASLTSQPPATDVLESRVTASEIAQRFKPELPRFTSPTPSELSPPTPLSQPNKSVPNNKADAAWSEYNHHWAGLFVISMGVLAALTKRDRLPWARFWPLLFLGLAGFILVRADPENWPLGPKGFWESFQIGDVGVHRLIAFLLVLFALSELWVQLGKARSLGMTAIFPAVCVSGGALLVIHSHPLGNVHEALLAEISHLLIAVAAILTGYSRWLELRMPGTFLGRIWPACFVVIGLVLLNYREGWV